MISDKQIDRALISFITNDWRKVARVVGGSMMDLGEKCQGRNDLYFAGRVAFLALTGVIEYQGDLGKMGHCEVRLPQEVKELDETLHDLSKATKDLLGGLSAEEAEILRVRFGINLNDSDGKQFEATRKRIAEIEKNALKKLRGKGSSDKS